MELENRKKILNKIQENPTWSNPQIAKSLGITRQTVLNVRKRFNDSLTVDRASGSGGKANKIDKKLASKIVRSVKDNPGLSDSDRAKRYKTSKSTGRRRRIDAGYKSYRAIKVPNRNDKQSETAKKRSRLLYDKVLTKHNGCLVMDDETYIKMDLKQLPGQKFYAAKERLGVVDKYKFVKVDKFCKKLLIWQAICSCGFKSKPFVTSSTLDSKIYIKECLQNRLLPFIRQHQDPVLFWPDLASCHYSKATMAWYEANGVDVVPKDMNPPNCPEFHPIEQYWADIKGKMKKTGVIVKNDKDMTARFNKAAAEITQAHVRDMMGSIKGKVRNFIHTGEMNC